MNVCTYIIVGMKCIVRVSVRVSGGTAAGTNPNSTTITVAIDAEYRY